MTSTLPESIDYEFKLDSPRAIVQPSKDVEVKGWIISRRAESVAVRVVHENGEVHHVPYGRPRPDITKARPHYPKAKTERSGFETVVSLDDGVCKLEIDLGDGFFTATEFEIVFDELSYKEYLNPKLSENYAWHQNLTDVKHNYYFAPEHPSSYIRHADDPKLIAFYLPQFHPLAQNDEAWGKGFTEWTNVTQGTPRFVGHEQPNLPSDLGFYDLRHEEVLDSQITLAKKYGIYAFCFYYYWFSGEKILDAPLNNLLKNKSWDFNFMICWANENWTKRWDGRDQEVIIAQKYLESDPIDFIKDVEHILLDSRYVTVEGKPILAVYRGSELGDPKKYIDTWREYFLKKHGKELHIVSMMNFDEASPLEYGFDAGVEFSPLTRYKQGSYDKEAAALNSFNQQLLDKNYTGRPVKYKTLIPSLYPHDTYNFPTYKCVSPSWDNDARKKGRKSGTFYGSTPQLYGRWLRDELSMAKSSGETSSPIFINAWNEWGEGTVLEPTIRYGHAYLRKTAEVLAEFSHSQTNKTSFLKTPFKQNNAKLAVVVHAFYEDEWKTISRQLKHIPTAFDLYVSIPRSKLRLKEAIHSEWPKAVITPVPNMGRDVLPFLTTYETIRGGGYEYVLKLHTKRTVHRSDGADWFEDVTKKLLGSKKNVQAIIKALEKDVGIVGPSGHLTEYSKHTKNPTSLQHINDISQTLGLHEKLMEKDTLGFFAGTMMWARLDTFDFLYHLALTPDDFEVEMGQRDGTLAHALERMLTVIPMLQGRTIAQSDGNTVPRIEDDSIFSEYRFTSATGSLVVDTPTQNEQTFKQKIELLETELAVLKQPAGYRLARKVIAPVRKARSLKHRLKNRLGSIRQISRTQQAIKKYYHINIVSDSRVSVVPGISIILRGINHPTSSAFIRLFGPLRTILAHSKEAIEIVEGGSGQVSDSVHTVIVQRTAIDTVKNAKALIAQVKKQGARLYVDSDDAFSKLDSSHPQYELHKERAKALQVVMEAADEVWFSTKRLQDAHPDVKSVVIENTMDPTLWTRPKSGKTKMPSSNEPLQIVYMGTKTHDGDFKLLVPVFDALYEKYPNEFKLHMIGAVNSIGSYPWLSIHRPPNGLYPEFVSWFNKFQSADIGISPLDNTDFNSYKSDIKCLDYIALGLKPIVSAVPAYQNKNLDKFIVRVNNTYDDWYNILEDELSNRDKNRRNAEGRILAGYEYLLKYRTPEVHKLTLEKRLERR